MRFVRAVWKLLVGVKDALVLILMLLFFGGLYAALSARPAPIGDGVLVLDLKGTVVEQPSQAAFADVLERHRRCANIGCATWSRRSTKRAPTTASKRSRSISTASSAAARPRSATLARRCAGCAPAASRCWPSPPPIATMATSSPSNASEIWLSPMGAVALAGPGGKNLYYKG